MVQEAADITSILDNLNPLFWRKGRLETFTHWPFQSKDHQCNPENMSAAGFYAIGGKDEPDLAECFMCRKQLDGWEPEDDPWEEHRKHQPNCQFITLDKRDEGSLTVKDLFQLMGHLYKQKINLECERMVDSIKKEWKETASSIPDIYEAMKKSEKTVD